MTRRKQWTLVISLLLSAVVAGLLIYRHRTRPIYDITTDYQDIRSGQERIIRTVRAEGPTVNGLKWASSLSPEFTTADDIFFFASLKTATNNHLIIRQPEHADRAYLLLTVEGQEPRQGRLSLGLHSLREIEARESGHQIASAAADLRVLFGRLKPGKYTLQLVLPRSGYSIAGKTPYSPADIASAKMEFQVLEPEVDRAIAATANPTQVDFLVSDEPYRVPWGTAYKARIINRRPVPIRILAYKKTGPAERVGLYGMQFELWRPNHGWGPSEGIIEYCTPEFDQVTIAPGGVFDCYVARYGGGIQRYKLAITYGVDSSQYSLVYSNTVVHDRFEETLRFNLARQPFLFGLAH